MTELHLNEWNWLAVGIGAVFYMAFGALYYSPALFGNRWIRVNRVKEGHMRNPLIYVPSTLAAVLGSLVTAWLAQATGADSWSDGLLLGLSIAALIALALGKNAAFGLASAKAYGIAVLEHAIAFIGLGILHGAL